MIQKIEQINFNKLSVRNMVSFRSTSNVSQVVLIAKNGIPVVEIFPQGIHTLLKAAKSSAADKRIGILFIAENFY